MRKERKSRERSGLNRVSHEVLIDIQDRGKIGLKEGDADGVRSGRRMETDLHRGVSSPSPSSRVPVEQFEELAVEYDFKFFVRYRAERLR